jgi:arylsulfatase A-like enzyme
VTTVNDKQTLLMNNARTHIAKQSALALSCMWGLSALSFAEQNKPNILFIFSDDHATDAIGAYDGRLKSVNPTPAIDKLAAQGMVMRNSFCTNSICGPSRSVILTGKHSHKNGFMNNGNSFDWDQQTFPKLLQIAGYQTALYGKSHLKGTPQGFDDWAVLPGQGDYFNPDFIFPEGKRVVEGYCSDVVTEMALDFLQKKRDPQKPFLLMVQHKAPHRNWMPAVRHLKLYADQDIPEPATLFDDYKDNASPVAKHEMGIYHHMGAKWDHFLHLRDDPSQMKDQLGKNFKRMTPAEFAAYQKHYGPLNAKFEKVKKNVTDRTRWNYQRYIKNYLRSVRGVDESVARLMKELDALGLANNTIVIYSSDQGFYLGDHGWYDKRWMYEESMQMPFIIKWPGVIKPGSQSEALIQNIDYGPTFLTTAGVPIPVDMQGLSLLPVFKALKGESPANWRDSLYYHYYEYPSVHMVPRQNGIRTERHKLIHFYQFDQWELYDLETDPDELHNLYGKKEHAELIAGLKKQLKALREYYDDRTDISPMPADWQKNVYDRQSTFRRMANPIKFVD